MHPCLLARTIRCLEYRAVHGRLRTARRKAKRSPDSIRKAGSFLLSPVTTAAHTVSRSAILYRLPDKRVATKPQAHGAEILQRFDPWEGAASPRVAARVRQKKLVSEQGAARCDRCRCDRCRGRRANLRRLQRGCPADERAVAAWPTSCGRFLPGCDGAWFPDASGW